MHGAITSANNFSGPQMVISRMSPVHLEASARKSNFNRPFMCPILRNFLPIAPLFALCFVVEPLLDPVDYIGSTGDHCAPIGCQPCSRNNLCFLQVMQKTARGPACSV